MADRTSYGVEVYDPTFNWANSDDPEDNWSVLNEKAFDTFSEAEEASKKYRGIYRSVRVVKFEKSTVARYQDGMTVE